MKKCINTCEEEFMKIELEKDIYADLEKIEERGKKKKGFSLFGRRKDEEDTGREAAEQFVDLEPEAPQPDAGPKPAPGPSTPGTEAAQAPGWQPLTGRKRQEAEHQLKEYKRKLNRAFIAKKLTQEQCLARVSKKEIELGLKPPR